MNKLSAMSRTDQFVIFVVVALILMQVLVLIFGTITNKLAFFISVLNLIVGASILLYWIQKQIRIEQHIVELREITVLCFELLIVGSAIYLIKTHQWQSWQRILQYIFFGIHLIALIAGLIFMLTFKMNRLI